MEQKITAFCFKLMSKNSISVLRIDHVVTKDSFPNGDNPDQLVRRHQVKLAGQLLEVNLNIQVYVCMYRQGQTTVV
jgi:hypothetical protein